VTMIGLAPILDFQKLGVTSVDQCKVIYSSIIGSRIDLGMQRSNTGNEWKERLLVDVAGWTMWFYASDVIRKLYLAAVVFGNKNNKEQLAGLLLSRKPKPVLEAKPTFMQRLGHGLQVVNWHLNPGGRWAVPSSKQLEQRRHQLLHHLATTTMEAAEKTHLKEELVQVFDKAISHNYMAVFLGTVLNIALLGFAIPKLNIALTRLRNACKLLGPTAELPAATASPNKNTETMTTASSTTTAQQAPAVTSAFTTSTPFFASNLRNNLAAYRPQNTPSA
jgi:hypothetical protein